MQQSSQLLLLVESVVQCLYLRSHRFYGTCLELNKEPYSEKGIECRELAAAIQTATNAKDMQACAVAIGRKIDCI